MYPEGYDIKMDDKATLKNEFENSWEVFLIRVIYESEFSQQEKDGMVDELISMVRCKEYFNILVEKVKEEVPSSYMLYDMKDGTKE